MAVAAILAAALMAWAVADPYLPHEVTRVVATDRDAGELLRDGYSRSATFRRLVATVESSLWRVFVQSGECPVPHTVGCLLHVVGSMNGERTLYIRVSPHARRRDLVIATIAHELQHASEVLQDPDVVDPGTMRALFARIGFQNVVEGGGIAFETADAERAGDVVRHELAAEDRP
jgi:hypothetical protein